MNHFINKKIDSSRDRQQHEIEQERIRLEREKIQYQQEGIPAKLARLYEYEVKERGLDGTFHDKIKLGDLIGVKWCVQNGALIDTDLCYSMGHPRMGESMGKTPLHLAVSCGHLPIVRYLIEQGVSVNKKNEYGNPALSLAIFGEYYDIIEYLIDNGANIDARTGMFEQPPIFDATVTGNYDITKLLIDKGASVDCYDNRGTHISEYAILNLNILKLLVESGMPVNINSKYGQPLIFNAVGCVLRFQEFKDNEKMGFPPAPITPGYMPAFRTVKYLVENGADINARFLNRLTALDYAKQISADVSGMNLEEIKMIIEYLKQQETDKEGSIPLK